MNVPQLRFNGFSGEWEEVSLGKLGDFTKGMALSKADISEEGDPCILYGELYTKYGPVINQVKSRTNSNQSKRVLGTKNDVLIPSSGETAIDIACASALEAEDVLLGGDLNIFRPKENVSGAFLSYQINGVRKFELSKLAQGASVVHLYSNSLKNFKVKLPTFEEQQKIALFFKFLDKKIEKQQVKIKQLEQLKKGMMQKIFSQELRFKDEDDLEFSEWGEGVLADIVDLTLRPVEKPREKYIRLGLRSHAKGTFHQIVEDPTSVAMDTLYAVKENDLIVNITFAWEHALALADSDDEGKLVSHRFPTYTFKKNIANPKFYEKYLLAPKIKYYLANASPGGAGRNRVMNKKEFLEIPILIPRIEEQKKIAAFLSVLDNKFDKEKEKLMVLDEQKRGFMRGMFV